MEIPLELFSLFIIISIALAGIGLWRKIPMLMFLGGFFIAFWSIQTDTIITDSFASGLTDNLYHYNVESFSFERSIFTDAATDRSIMAEHVSSSSSMLNGDSIECVELYLRKVGSTPTDTITYGVWDVNGNNKHIFGTLSSALLTTSHTPYTLCSVSTYTLIPTDRIGVEFDAGDSSNNISVRLDALNPFDGTTTFHQEYNDVSNSWTSFTVNDMTGSMFIQGEDLDITNNNFVFDGYAKVMFIVFGAIMLLAGAIVWKLD